MCTNIFFIVRAFSLVTIRNEDDSLLVNYNYNEYTIICEHPSFYSVTDLLEAKTRLPIKIMKLAYHALLIKMYWNSDWTLMGLEKSSVILNRVKFFKLIVYSCVLLTMG